MSEEKPHGFMKVADECTILVGAEVGDYHGPVAEISYDGTWLWIVTDQYEGSAMLNIEALASLRRALSRIAKQIKQGKP